MPFLHILHNPCAGSPARNAALFQAVTDLLTENACGYSVNGDLPSGGDLCVIGGDGTLHSVLAKNARVVLIPAGSSNAMFNYLFPVNPDPLASLRSFLSQKNINHLQLRQVSIGNREPKLQAVVTSLMAHANLVHTADLPEFREKYAEPDSRYAAAFQQQVGRSARGTLTLSGSVQKWDSHQSTWIDTNQSQYNEEWSYILQPSCDRLTHDFIIAPHSPTDGWTDFVLVFKHGDLPAAMENAFKGNTRQDDNTVYLRCTGEWSYFPEPSSDAWGRLVLCDGDIEEMDINSTLTGKLAGHIQIWT